MEWAELQRPSQQKGFAADAWDRVNQTLVFNADGKVRSEEQHAAETTVES